jgi:hypothetical protein
LIVKRMRLAVSFHCMVKCNIKIANEKEDARMPRVNKTIQTTSNEYMPNGVAVSPAVPVAGDSVRIVYDGLLAKSGASHLYVHVGFGSNWDTRGDYPMIRTSTGFEANVPVKEADTLNVCFKDCASNWDNNSGKNYTFDIVQ